MAWKIDAAHSLVEFTVKHMMIATVRGRFDSFDGDIIVDPDNLLASRVEGWVETASVDTRDEKRDGRSPWTRIAELRLPAAAPHPQLKSCEPVNGGRGAFGRSWFTAQGGDDKDRDTSIWILGFDKQGHHFARRLDDGATSGKPARRLDPESLVGERELLVYYTLVDDGPAQLRLCRTGIGPAVDEGGGRHP